MLAKPGIALVPALHDGNESHENDESEGDVAEPGAYSLPIHGSFGALLTEKHYFRVAVGQYERAG